MSGPLEVQAELELGESDGAVVDQARLALLLAASANIPMGIAVYGADQRLAFVNDRFEADFGRPSEKLESSLADRRPGGRSGQPFQRETPLPDGRRIRLSLRELPCGGWLAVTEDITAQRRAEDHALHVTQHDGLTGLGNRGLLHRRFEEAVGRQRYEALLHIDLDEFKPVNAHYGYAIGDGLLRAAAARIVDNLREVDFVARFGGDEFVVLLSRTDRFDGLDHVALRLILSTKE